MYLRVKTGLHEVLSRLDTSGTVLLPSYVPGGVAWAALTADFDVRYYPVRADMTLPIESVKKRIHDVDPEVVLFIHYFGFVDESYRALLETARDIGATVVEDCARGLFSRDSNGELLGSTGDVALYCLHKTLPAPNGGLVVTRDVSLPKPARTCSERQALLRAVGASVLGTLGVRVQRTPPVIDQPLSGEPNTVSPAHAPREPGAVSRRALNSCDPKTVQETRLEHYRALRDRLVDVDGIDVLTPPAPERAAPYGVAVLMPSGVVRQHIYNELYRRRLPSEVLTWPAVHRHDVVAGHDGALALRQRLIVLPTHQQLPSTTVPRLADCIIEYLES